MKRLLLISTAIVLPMLGYAQVTLDDIPLEQEFSHVFYSDKEINQKMVDAKTWIATNFGDYQSVLQLEDNENYRIIIKGKTPIVRPSDYISYQYPFTMTFDFKEDRYRIKVEDIGVYMGFSALGELKIPNMKMVWEERFPTDTSGLDEARKKGLEKDIVNFKSTFADIFNSAAKKIEENDDF